MKVVPPPLSGDYTPLSDHIDLDESQMSYGTKSSTFGDSNSVSNDFVSCDNSDKSSEVNTNDFASSDSSVKSSEPKSNDSTSCASTSSVSTSESEAEIESNVGTPIQEPIIVILEKNASSVSKLCFVCGSSTHLIKDCDFYEKQMANKTVGNGVGPVHSRNNVNHQNQFVPQAVLLRTGKVNIPPARPQPVPTGKPKVPAPVPTGRQNRPFPVPTDRGYSPSVTSGWWKSTARPMPHLNRPTSSYFQTYTPYVPQMYYNHMKYGGVRWATAVKPSAGCSWKTHRKGLYWENPYSDAEDEGIFDSGCSRSMTELRFKCRRIRHSSRLLSMRTLHDEILFFGPSLAGWEVISTPLGEINVSLQSSGVIHSQEGGKGSSVWNHQSLWQISSWRLYTLSSVHVLETVSGEVLYMFADVFYPLSVKLIERMLKHKLEIDKDFLLLCKIFKYSSQDSSRLDVAAKFIFQSSRYVVPTGRVVVHTGRYVVPAGRVLNPDINFSKQESLLCLACDYIGYSPSLTCSKDLSELDPTVTNAKNNKKNFLTASNTFDALNNLVDVDDGGGSKTLNAQEANHVEVHCRKDKHADVPNSSLCDQPPIVEKEVNLKPVDMLSTSTGEQMEELDSEIEDVHDDTTRFMALLS
ncbi:hypothetical protein Tco_1017550 [Tanacetum coccineum]|uniref:CCHC-type domain-containing protein n=1 Tax=Tanacetum coccineum TaxID=301880 RepID=A0ABQ5FS10_9ASTR